VFNKLFPGYCHYFAVDCNSLLSSKLVEYQVALNKQDHNTPKFKFAVHFFIIIFSLILDFDKERTRQTVIIVQC